MSRSFKAFSKDISVIFSGTLLSRILGFLRDVLIAKFFGTGPALEAFLVAFRLPNFFRFLMGEGASDSVVVPVLSEYRNRKELYLVGRKLISFSFVILSVVSWAEPYFPAPLLLWLRPDLLKTLISLTSA